MRAKHHLDQRGRSATVTIHDAAMLVFAAPSRFLWDSVRFDAGGASPSDEL
ncbi:MAG: hypothetical protein H7A54_00410 [Akkermansiaceae bacterium]|nr:hypothetical protein [Akkermansiaceae bacterium]